MELDRYFYRKIAKNGEGRKPYMMLKPLREESFGWEKFGNRYSSRGIVSFVDSHDYGFKFVFGEGVEGIMDVVRDESERRRVSFMGYGKRANS